MQVVPAERDAYAIPVMQGDALIRDAVPVVVAKGPQFGNTRVVHDSTASHHTSAGSFLNSVETRRINARAVRLTVSVFVLQQTNPIVMPSEFGNPFAQVATAGRIVNKTKMMLSNILTRMTSCIACQVR